MLSLVRSTKNTFVPINQFPPEVLSLIAWHHFHPEDPDEELITLTHVCRSWREILISHASLWTSLDCTDVDKTRVYLERSKTSPLKIHLEHRWLCDAFLLTVPHLDRLGSLFLTGAPNDLLQLIQEHFVSPAPLLKTFSIWVTEVGDFSLQDSIFGGDLSSLHELLLDGAVTNLAWENMSNLTKFELRTIPPDKISVTQLLNLFERAPLLRDILLEEAFPDFSDARPGRVLSLPNLEKLVITAQPLHTILTNHLLIPTGASISQAFSFYDTKSPIHSHLPKDLTNLKNLSSITSINLDFDHGAYLRLEGPSGGHYILGDWAGGGRISANTGRRVVRSLDVFNVSAVEKLAIGHWRFAAPPSSPVEESSIYRTLHRMNNLRTLTLTSCLNLPFIHTLDPVQNGSGTVICPKLEQLILYVKRQDRFYLKELLAMAKERASRGAKLGTITINCADAFVPVSEVLELRTWIPHVEYRLGSVTPAWDAIPRDVRRTDYEQ